MRRQTHGFHPVGAATAFLLNQHLPETAHSHTSIRLDFSLTHSTLAQTRIYVPYVNPYTKHPTTHYRSSKSTHSRRLSLLRRALHRRQDVATVDPTLHPDHAVGGAGFRKTVVDIGAQRVQRQTSLQVPFRARDFVAVQPAGDTHLDSFTAEAQRRIHRLAHRSAEAHALFQLQRDRLRNQL